MIVVVFIWTTTILKNKKTGSKPVFHLSFNKLFNDFPTIRFYLEEIKTI
jgi:hypothetical protein